jgi:hypothetical protein
MDSQNIQSVEIRELETQSAEVINDLDVPKAEVVKGGEKLPSPNLPISSPKPPRK